MNKLTRVVSAVSAAALVAMPLLAAAQVTTIGQSNITSINAFITFLQGLLRFLFTLFGILAVLLILWSAILFLTSGANEERRKAATGYLKWGIVAIVVAVISFTIIPLVQSFVSIQ